MNRSLAALSFVSLAALAALSGCRSDDDGGDGVDVDAPVGDDMKIQDVQSDTMAAETAVTVRGVVVVAIDAHGGRTGNFYVMEPEGGPFSGVLVFGASTDQVSALQLGDLVDITGAKKDEFSLDDDDATVTELSPASTGSLQVTRVGSGTVPAPHVVDALAFGRMSKAEREAEYEKWEGVLVRVENVSVLNNVRQIGSTDPTFRGFGVTGLYEVDSSLAPIPAPPDSGVTEPYVARGDCLASVTGMGDYFYEYKVLPRMTADIVKGGTGCPAREMGDACSDSMDNDANGFADCMDNACLGSSSACSAATTIEMIQTGAVTGGVSLNDVIVTGVDTIGSTQGIWVSQAAQAAANQGIFVFTGATAPSVMIGALVDVVGVVKEFDVGNPAMGDTLTEIEQSTVTPATGTATPVPLSGVAVSALADIGMSGEPYESVLVQLTNLRVMAEQAPGDRVVLTNGTNTIVMDDDIFNYAAGAYPVGTCFATLTGIMTVNLFDNERRFLPRSASDLVTTGGNCN